MGSMSTDPATPHGRIVFNACLTASNENAPGSVDPNASMADQQQQMQAALAANPSLVTTMRAIAAAQGRGHLDVRGGNGSFGTVGLLDGAGNLDIVADGADLDGGGHADRTLDPELTNPDKFIYIERGTDPGGCMSAVAECWAQDAARAITSVQTRRGAPIDGSWDEAVIQCFYELADTQYAAIARLASRIEGFAKLGKESEPSP